MQIYYRPIEGDAHTCAWSLLADALAANGHALSSYTLCRTLIGKPYFTEPGAPCFSLSHTKQIAVCAISSTPIGVDAEPCDRRVSPAVCRRFLGGCSPSEALQKWTEHESFGKLTGEGAASQTIPFNGDTLCFHSYTTAGHLLTVCHLKTDTLSPPQEL